MGPDLDSEDVLDLEPEPEPEPDPDLPVFEGFFEGKRFIMGRVQTSVTLRTPDVNYYPSLDPLYG